MSTGPTVPPDTSSWEEAVANGFYGDRTDPLPDQVYEVDAITTYTPALTAVAPAAQDAAFEGAWALTCTGTFPIMDKTKWRVVIVAADGSEWPSLDLTLQALDTLDAHYVGGPNYPDAAGAGQVELRNGTVVHGSVAFTWNYTPPAEEPA